MPKAESSIASSQTSRRGRKSSHPYLSEVEATSSSQDIRALLGQGPPSAVKSEDLNSETQSIGDCLICRKSIKMVRGINDSTTMDYVIITRVLSMRCFPRKTWWRDR